jgi:two-component sensor histidine kinase/PAS domain-containing protein
MVEGSNESNIDKFNSNLTENRNFRWYEEILCELRDARRIKEPQKPPGEDRKMEEEVRHVQRVLHMSNQLLETILDNTHMCIAYMDPKFNFIKVNRLYAEADERPQSFFPGLNHFDLYPNEENEKKFRLVVETGEPCFVTAKAFWYEAHPERGVTYWDWSLIPVRSDSGAISGVVLTLKNVTERVVAEMELNRQLKVMESLTRLYAPLSSPQASFKEISEAILTEAKLLTASAHGYVSSIDPGTGDNIGHTLTQMMQKQCRLANGNRRIAFPVGENGWYASLWGHCLNTRLPFYSNSPGNHIASSGVPDGHIPIERFLSVPVLLGDQLVGQISLANATRDYSDRDLEVVGRLGQYYGLAVRRVQDRNALKESQNKLKESLEEKELLLKEIHHRTRNNMTIVSSMLNLQAVTLDDPRLTDILRDAQSRIRTLAMVHERIFTSGDMTNVNFNIYVREITYALFRGYNIHRERITLETDIIADLSIDLKQAIPCGLIINELVSNSIKHAFPTDKEGKISVSIRKKVPDKIEICIRDNGCGLPADIDVREPDSIGLKLITMMVNQLKGSLEFNRTKGTEIKIFFPFQ